MSIHFSGRVFYEKSPRLVPRINFIDNMPIEDKRGRIIEAVDINDQALPHESTYNKLYGFIVDNIRRLVDKTVEETDLQPNPLEFETLLDTQCELLHQTLVHTIDRAFGNPDQLNTQEELDTFSTQIHKRVGEILETATPQAAIDTFKRPL
jgi:hypothetical protein